MNFVYLNKLNTDLLLAHQDPVSVLAFGHSHQAVVCSQVSHGLCIGSMTLKGVRVY